MTVTDIGLAIMIVIALLFAVFDEFIVHYALRGKTRLRVPLRRQGRLDGLVFIVLRLILLYKNITTGGTVVTLTLILILSLMVVYLAYIRRPRMLFKTEVFLRQCIYPLFPHQKYEFIGRRLSGHRSGKTAFADPGQ